MLWAIQLSYRWRVHSVGGGGKTSITIIISLITNTKLKNSMFNCSQVFVVVVAGGLFTLSDGRQTAPMPSVRFFFHWFLLFRPPHAHITRNVVCWRSHTILVLLFFCSIFFRFVYHMFFFSCTHSFNTDPPYVILICAYVDKWMMAMPMPDFFFV